MTRRQLLPGTCGLRLRKMAVCCALLVTVDHLAVLAADHPVHKPTYTVLYKFTGGDDGGSPAAGLNRDSQGNLYGTTEYGGAFDYGVVFKLSPSGSETVLHTFTGSEGMWPAAALIPDSNGNLYGTTTQGGTPEGGGCTHGCGTVFKIDTAGTYSVVYAFQGDTYGSYPAGRVIFDRTGTLYSTTNAGGYSSGSCAYSCLGEGCGVAFKLDKYGKESVLHTFRGYPDGACPSDGLIQGNSGDWYGTTWSGGSSDAGTIFKVDSAGQETIVYNFTGGTDGGWPEGSLVRDEAGNLYGMTLDGGNLSCGYQGSGCGVVFKVDSSGNETVLYEFDTIQWLSDGELLRDRVGNLYGATGSSGGTLFKLKTNGKLRYYILSEAEQARTRERG